MISEKLSTDSRRMLQKGVPQFVGFCRCTPCRQRRGKVALEQRGLDTTRMHPVQAAPRQSTTLLLISGLTVDAPRAGSAEAKPGRCLLPHRAGRCTPCRQRRGKVYGGAAGGGKTKMHPVQAAPRQSLSMRGQAKESIMMHPVQAAPRQSAVWRAAASWAADAPRAGSAEAKSLIASVTASRWGCTPCRQRRGKGGAVGGGNRQRPDAPRAGSAQRNNNVPPDGSLTTGRHFFTFPPSRIPTVAPSSSVTMYNPAPHLLDRSSMAKQNLSYRANVICDGAPPRISAAAVV